MKKVLKKGKFVFTRKGSVVLELADEIYSGLKPFSKKIMIVGSIRRGEKNPVDVDIVLIPKDRVKIMNYLGSLGKFEQGGEKRSTFKIKKVKVEIYYAEPKSWGAMLLTYTGPFQYNIGLRVLAKKKGMLLNQYGIFRDGKYLAGKSERDVYSVLEKKYKFPRNR
jgi:DNA polymerase (family 10)